VLGGKSARRVGWGTTGVQIRGGWKRRVRLTNDLRELLSNKFACVAMQCWVRDVSEQVLRLSDGDHLTISNIDYEKAGFCGDGVADSSRSRASGGYFCSCKGGVTGVPCTWYLDQAPIRTNATSKTAMATYRMGGHRYLPASISVSCPIQCNSRRTYRQTSLLAQPRAEAPQGIDMIADDLGGTDQWHRQQ